MAAAEERDGWWLDTQRRREERMRYEVLYAIYHAAERTPCVQIDTVHFLGGLGIWREELDHVLLYLTRRGFLSADVRERVAPPGDDPVVCITQKGIDYIQRDARKRKTIREEPRRNES